MKIIDETGAVIENPDLTLGYLKADTETVEHPAVEAVEEEWHWETIAEYPNGGKDVKKVIDVPGVEGREAWTEQVPIQRYILYTAEELAQQEQEKADDEARRKLPETVAALRAALDDADAMTVDHEYRLALLEYGITDNA